MAGAADVHTQQDLCMKKRTGTAKAGITIYMTLTLLVMVSLITGAIKAAKVQAGRAAAANGADQAVFSVLAHYDRQMMEKYGIFCVNAGSAEALGLGGVTDMLDDSMNYLLVPNKGRAVFGGKNLLSLANEGTALSGYTLLTDQQGKPFEAQAIQCVKDTAALSVIEALQRKAAGAKSTEAAGAGELAEAEKTSYADLKAKAAEAKSGEAAESDTPSEVPDPPADFKDPLPLFETIRSKSLLEFVAPNGISDKSASADDLSGASPRESGIGVIDVSGCASGGTDYLLYVEYLREHFSSYGDPSGQSALAYQLEYILGGKATDKKNLESVVLRLLLVREGINIAFLYADPAKCRELDTTSLTIAGLMGIPELYPAVRLVLAAGWAYAESVIDVRALLEGKRVAAVKTPSSWQVGLGSLETLISNPGGLTKDIPGGLGYDEYLGIFLLTKKNTELTPRALAMIQSEIRGSGNGYEQFRVDCCLDSLSVRYKVRSESLVTFEVEKTAGYRDL